MTVKPHVTLSRFAATTSHRADGTKVGRRCGVSFAGCEPAASARAGSFVGCRLSPLGGTPTLHLLFGGGLW